MGAESTSSSGGGIDRNDRRYDTPVVLNVYDLTPMNNYSVWFGLGIFHSGIEGLFLAQNLIFFSFFYVSWFFIVLVIWVWFCVGFWLLGFLGFRSCDECEFVLGYVGFQDWYLE